MSFSSQIKEKLCKSEYGCMNCAAYELSGALMFGGNIGSDSIKFATENENIAKRITADINTGLRNTGGNTGYFKSTAYYYR